jgi:hypothetical protein
MTRGSADDIPTAPFPSTHLGFKQCFVLGDNRSESQDGRDLGRRRMGLSTGTAAIGYSTCRTFWGGLM